MHEHDHTTSLHTAHGRLGGWLSRHSRSHRYPTWPAHKGQLPAAVRGTTLCFEAGTQRALPQRKSKPCWRCESQVVLPAVAAGLQVAQVVQLMPCRMITLDKHWHWHWQQLALAAAPEERVGVAAGGGSGVHEGELGRVHGVRWTPPVTARVARDADGSQVHLRHDVQCTTTPTID